MYEVFNRLNTGGVNLRPQEIRTSMYHSPFYEMLYRVNIHPQWRRLVVRTEPDLHMKDVEILLRGFAFLIDGENYAPSMVKFLNQFSRKCQTQNSAQNEYLRGLITSFFDACSDLPEDAFVRYGRFNVALFEATFTAVASEAFAQHRHLQGKVSATNVRLLESDPDFTQAMLEGTTQTRNVSTRLARAKAILGSL
jgi:hypothetical protein